MANKKRLIDANMLMKQVKAIHKAVDTSKINTDYDTGFHSATSQVQGLIAYMSTVDAVEVVRCKDCLHQRKYWHKPPECHCLLYDRATREDGFCDRGEPMPANKKRAYQLYGKEKEKGSPKLG